MTVPLALASEKTKGGVLDSGTAEDIRESDTEFSGRKNEAAEEKKPVGTTAAHPKAPQFAPAANMKMIRLQTDRELAELFGDADRVPAAIRAVEYARKAAIAGEKSRNTANLLNQILPTRKRVMTKEDEVFIQAKIRGIESLLAELKAGKISAEVYRENVEVLMSEIEAR